MTDWESIRIEVDNQNQTNPTFSMNQLLCEQQASIKAYPLFIRITQCK